MRKRIVVVGGGLAGLSAAATAATAATAARGVVEVVLLEARSSLGGRGRTDEQNGFLLNQGAHALYAASAGVVVLKELGITPRGGRPSRHGYGRLRGKVGLLPGTTLDSIRSNLIGFKAKAQLGKLLADPAKALKTPTADGSMQQWIEEQVSDPDARLVLAMATRTATYLSDLTTIAACVAVPQVIGALTDGVLYLDGGWQQIVDALRGAATRAGAKIETDRKIGSLSELDDCDAVILANGGPAHAAGLIGDASRLVGQWAAAAQPVHASALDLGLRSLPVPRRRLCFAVDEPLYLSTHTPSAKLAAQGGEVVHLLRYGDADACSPGSDTSGADARREMEGLLDDAQPGWRSQVAAERFSRRLVVAHDRPTPSRGPLNNRPGPAIPDCQNIFVAGDWVGSRGLLGDAALASGHDAALLALAAD
jgi:phytoene dehydrogenase-like protein